MLKRLTKTEVVRNLWLLALGYFVFYVPYSALVKALSSGVIHLEALEAGATGITNGLILLPSILLGTVITMPLALYLLGWFSYLKRRLVAGLTVPVPSRWTVVSGVAFAAIIITTTLAYSFHGVSIVLALLLMRGGVLMMSPLVDSMYARPVHWYSWAGFLLSMLAVTIALAQLHDYSLPFLVLVNLAVYLLAYSVRLQFITRFAKDVDEAINRGYFVEEMAVAMLVLITIPGLVAIVGNNPASTALRSGFHLLFAGDIPWLVIVTGCCYGLLGIFGSLLYLNRRENTLVIPVNRCTSLLSGVVATYILSSFFQSGGVAGTQLVGVALVMAALLLISVFDARHMAGKDKHDPLQRVFLFVCDSSCTCSLMAAAICNNEIQKHLGLQSAVTEQSGIYAKSAGLSAPRGQKITPEANAVLSALAVPVRDQEASQINSYGVHRAEQVLCMTNAQRLELIRSFPWARGKILCLDETTDIVAPDRLEFGGLQQLGQTLHDRISLWLPAGSGVSRVREPRL
jgi:protein-tyrosine-phosphatase